MAIPEAVDRRLEDLEARVDRLEAGRFTTVDAEEPHETQAGVVGVPEVEPADNPAQTPTGRTEVDTGANAKTEAKATGRASSRRD